ncbi:MAG: MFS transporter, partial [Desulfurococcales archaeon]|nr:MFS transporter [Desulfurococcales archaeon]
MENGVSRRALAAVVSYNVFRGLAVGGYMALFPMYMVSLGYSMESLGLVIAASGALSAFILPALGVVIDRYGPRIMVFVTGLMQVAGILIAAYSSSLETLGLSYLLFLLSFLAGQPARMSFLARAVDEGVLGRAVGLTSSIFSMTRLIGPLAGGFAAEALGFKASFQALALSSAVGLILFTVISTGVALRPLSRVPSLREAYMGVLRPGRSMAGVLGYVALDRLGWSLWFPMLTGHLYSYGFSESEAGLIVTLGGVVQTLLLPPAGAMVDRLGAAKVLAVSEGLGVLTALLFADPSSIYRVYLGAALMGASIAFWVPG